MTHAEHEWNDFLRVLGNLGAGEREDLAGDMDVLRSTTVPTELGRRGMLKWVADQMRKDHRVP
ncbi:hypothetical protein LVB87_14435 [Lysobacter sp. KIS68-7]|uniref:hypothetical protein n=1 Tax=Lysobacter sp. KIS68-7 TaxID=2904252 RepID=UPI001E4B81A9|nr:hypothetical protein [Lysobacter sp. KIS68-7]UHQ19365.1 hypothetical protein LVB87_14435 [Lysobacter sp. KIS68-7]